MTYLTEDEAKTRWPIRGVKRSHTKGYVRYLCPDHPNAGSDGYVYAHRYVASLIVGRPLLKSEHVHHRNGNPANNNRNNLQIVSGSEHRLIHSDGRGAHSTRPVCAACGEPISYASTTGLCRTHYWDAMRAMRCVCKVDGCRERAGFRSGLCRQHMRQRSNKRRYNSKWEFSNVSD